MQYKVYPGCDSIVVIKLIESFITFKFCCFPEVIILQILLNQTPVFHTIYGWLYFSNTHSMSSHSVITSLYISFYCYWKSLPFPCWIQISFIATCNPAINFISLISVSLFAVHSPNTISDLQSIYLSQKLAIIYKINIFWMPFLFAGKKRTG